MGKIKKSFALVSPDLVTTKYVSGQLDRVEVAPHIVTTGRRELKKIVNSPERVISTLLLVPSLSLGTDQIDMARQVVKSGGLVLAWTMDEPCSEISELDEWLLERLLELAGAKTSPRINVLVCAARFSLLGVGSNTKTVRFSGRKSAIRSRLVPAFQAKGFTISSGKSPSWNLRIQSSGHLSITGENTPSVAVDEPWISAEALHLISHEKAEGLVPSFGVPSPSMEQLESIAKPPPRLLSETTSKRLAAFFKIPAPRERLCQSATEATRYASTVDGPVVVKLVRPAFEQKMASGGVLTHVEGPAAIRRAVHSLESLGKRLSPPKPLGVLVSEQLSYEIALWLKMLDHDIFGRLVLVGLGEFPDDSPQFALSAESSYEDAYRALAKLEGIIPAEDWPSLSATVAWFCDMVRVLDKRINRAEMHPLVSLDGHEEAVALDVLIGIGYPGSA